MPLGLLLDVVEMPIDGLDPRRDGPTGLLGDVLLALDDVQRGRDQSQRPLRCPRAKAQRRRDPTGLLLDVVQLPPQQSRRRRDANLTGFDDVEPARRRRRDRPTGLAQSLWTPLRRDSRRLAMPRRRRRADSASSNPSRSDASRRRREHLDVVLSALDDVQGGRGRSRRPLRWPTRLARRRHVT